ncbi:MAG: hypothetical protein ABR574_07555 [Cryomorphaceae bacterium]|nr:hypothetical protein [Flavobacteriales bacterium]
MKHLKLFPTLVILFVFSTGSIAQPKFYMNVNSPNGYLVPADPGAPGIGINESNPQHSLHILEAGHENTALFLDLKQTQAPSGQGVGGYFQPDYAFRVNYQRYGLQSGTVFSISETGQTRINWENTSATENLVVSQDLAVYRIPGKYLKMGFDGTGSTPTMFWGSGGSEHLQFKSSATGNTPLYLSEAGTVGVGTDNFSGGYSLNVKDEAVVEYLRVQQESDWGVDDDFVQILYGDRPEFRWKSTSGENLEFISGDETPLRISPTGKVGINTNNFENSNHSLYIAGSSVAEEMFVKLSSDWGDFVFEKDYDLMPLEALEAFVMTNKHLPGIKTAEDISENGLALGETERVLTIKVEELTLYLIEMKKEIDALKSII